MRTTVPITITLPASEPVTLFEPQGDPQGIDALAGIVLEAAGRYDEYSDESAQFHRLRGWGGESSEQYVKRAKRVAARAGRMRNTLKRTGRALLACADRLRNHRRTYEEHVERKARLDRRLEALRAEIEGATSLTFEQGQVLQSRADELAEKYAALVQDDRELARLVRSNEELMVETLESADEMDEAVSETGGRPETALRAMQRKGSPMGGESSPEQVRQWWKELSPEERRAVVASYSHLIAGAEGIPPEVRERADRIRDEEVITRLESKEADRTISAEEQERLARRHEEATREARERGARNEASEKNGKEKDGGRGGRNK